MILRKVHSKAMSRLLEFHSLINGIYLQYLYDFRIIHEPLHLSRKNKSRTKFISNGFSEDFLLVFALVLPFSLKFYEFPSKLH